MSNAQRVFITGGASGLGLAFARQYARRGWRVALGDINAEGLKAAAEELQASAAAVITLPCNVQRMEDLQQAAAQQDIAWRTIISSAPGKQGHVTPEQANAITAGEMEGRPQAYPAAVILDPEGNIGRMYEAKTSPHMFVIDEAGVLQYDGAIDDSPRGPADEADNHVEAALAALQKGEPVDPAQTTPYGCSVKYADS